MPNMTTADMIIRRTTIQTITIQTMTTPAMITSPLHSNPFISMTRTLVAPMRARLRS